MVKGMDLMNSNQLKVNLNLLKPKTFHLQWHITERCNLKCKHCYQEGTYLENELPIETLFNIVDQYIDALKKWEVPSNLARISLTGGEPLIRKDFFRLLEKCYESRSYFTYHVMTNGCLIDKEVVRKLKELGVRSVQISLEGLEEKNDSIRGKGTFNKICNAIKALVEESIHVSISMTIAKHNIDDVLGVIKLCKDLHVNGLGLRRLVPCGSGSQLRDKMLSPLELKNLYKLITNISVESGLVVMTGCENSLWTLEDPSFVTHGCSTAYDSLTILPNGDVFPCRRLPIKVGNVTEQKLHDIWYSSDILWDLRNKNNLNSLCRNCSNFERCIGGARCVAYGYFGDLFAPDPQCWLAFTELPKFKYKEMQINKEKILLVEKYLKV